MRRFLYLAAAIVWAGLGASAFGQGMGGGGAGGGAGGGTGTSGGAGGTGLTGGGNSFSGGSGGTSLLGNTGGNTTLGGSGGTNRTGTGRTGTAGSFAPAQSNLFGGTYGNPLYNGRPGSTNLSLTTPGGFGAASYGTTTGTGTGTGTAGRTTGTGGRATVRSGTTGGTTGQTGPLTSVSYIAELKFPVAPVVPTAIQAELQGVINRTSMWKGPATVTVEMVGTTAVLRGRVSDADDKRMVEGMVRLTPGVRDVINEITSP